MIRLVKHEELVEAIAVRLAKWNCAADQAPSRHDIQRAEIALDALLEAAVRLGVVEPLGEVADPGGKVSVGPLYTLSHNDAPIDGYILRLEERTDDARTD